MTVGSPALILTGAPARLLSNRHAARSGSTIMNFGRAAPRLVPRVAPRVRLMFAATGLGPYFGQAVHFKHFAPEKVSCALVPKTIPLGCGEASRLAGPVISALTGVR